MPAYPLSLGVSPAPAYPLSLEVNQACQAILFRWGSIQHAGISSFVGGQFSMPALPELAMLPAPPVWALGAARAAGQTWTHFTSDGDTPPLARCIKKGPHSPVFMHHRPLGQDLDSEMLI